MEVLQLARARPERRASSRATSCSPASACCSARWSASCPASARRSPSRCCCRSPSSSTRPARSSCSPASTSAACTAARPPPSCSTRRARAPRSRPRSRATRWRKAGRGGPALATAAIGSFVAGTLATARPRLARAVARRPRGRLRPVGLLRADGARLRHGLGDLRQLAAARPDEPVPRPRARPGRHRQADRPGAARLRRAGAARRRRDHDAGGRACSRWARRSTSPRAAPASQETLEAVRGSLWMTLEDWKRSWKPWLRGIALGFPIGALPAGGAEMPTFLSYTIESRLAETPGGVRQGRDRRRRRPGGREQRLRHRHAGAAAHPRPADLGDGGDDARRLPAIRPGPGPAALRRPTPTWSGA